MFARGGPAWRQEAYVKAANTGAGDLFGWSVALSCDGAILAAGAGYEESAATGAGGDPADDSVTAAGAVYVFDRLP
ncbi:MAG TPA: FG-GAP repeat protein [Kofleriaceae bacterium]|nr:FG-GAP repeat protein [Kofleriaceae bacterium]